MWSSAADIINFSGGGVEFLELDSTEATFTTRIAVGGSSSGMSTIALGLTVNNTGVGADATSDFIAKSLSSDVALVVDSSEDVVKTGVGRIMNTSRYTANQTLNSQDHIVFCNGTFTITLPAGIEGTNYKIINSGTGVITVDPDGTEQVYGGGAGVAQTLDAGEVINIHYNTTDGWY